MTDASQASWGDPPARWNHYVKHGRAVGAANEQQYDASARETIRTGERFTYRVRTGSVPRVGYYDSTTGRFTGLNASERRIVTHYSMSEIEVRRLPESTYGKRGEA